MNGLTDRVADELGVGHGVAAALLADMRRRVGGRGSLTLAAGFVIATQPALRRVLPRRVRRRVERRFLESLLEDVGSVLTLLGAASSAEQSPCRGLLASG